MRLIQDFYEGKFSLENINGSLITLIHKMISPEGPGDFRPISLVSVPIKIITKLLVNRLQAVITQIMSKNIMAL